MSSQKRSVRWRREDLLHPATILAAIALFIALGGVTYAAATIGTSDIQNSAVTTPKIARGAVTNSKLRTGQVSNSKLATHAVTNSKIGPFQVSTSKIKNRAVIGGKIANGAVGTNQLANLGVTNAKLANGSVTTGKVANNAITSAQLANGSVTASKLATLAVSGRGSVASFRQVVPNGQNATIFAFPGLGTITATCANGAATTSLTNQSGTNLTIWNSGIDNGAPDTPFVDRSEPANGGTITHANTAVGGVESIEWQASFTDGNGTEHTANASITSGATLTNCTVAGTAYATG
jgi:hypothetical protein